MNRQSRFGGTALANSSKDSRQIADPVRIGDELGCRQRLVMSEDGFRRRELHEAGFEGVERIFLLNGEELRYALPVAAQVLRFERLSNILVQPLRTASAGHLVDERVCQLCRRNPCRLGIHRIHAVNWNSRLKLVDCCGPGRSPGLDRERLALSTEKLKYCSAEYNSVPARGP